MTMPLLTTKLNIPPVRPNLVRRPRLIERLNTGLHRKLTLISAPAGFGKTTLVAEWQQESQPAMAWLSLEKDDNDLTHFLTYLVAAFQKVEANLGQSIPGILGMPTLPPIRTLLTELVNDLAAASTPLILVLDDYHAIEATAIHQTVQFLLDHAPPMFHLALLTRADPPLSLSRWRARGQITEIRADDLRFNREETGDFFAGTMGLDIEPAAVDALEKRTEGWAVGLQFAALSLQGRSDTPAFIESFTASHHYILEYLLEEVLQQQPEPLQRFLVETSLLNRLCGPLCDRVTERTDSAEVLAELHRRNLFIIPLDSEYYWFRYHHLFADLLNGYLRRSRPAGIPLLHRRAATWCEENGDAREAVRHALAAQDFQQASQVMVNNWRRLFHQGWLNTAVRWLESLPPDIVRRSPPLNIAYGWTLFVRGDYGRIPPFIEEATQAFDELVASGHLPADQPEYHIITQQVELLGAVVARYRGDVAAAVNLVERALASVPIVRHTLGPAFAELAYGSCYLQMGHNYLAAGDLEKAAAFFGRSSPHSGNAGNIFAMTSAIFELARIRQEQNRLLEAEAACHEALALAERPEYAGWPAFCLVHLALADVLQGLDRFDQAEAHLQQGLDSARRSGHVLYLAHGYLVAARLHQVQGDTTAARAAWQGAQQVAMEIDNPDLRQMLAAVAGDLAVRPANRLPQPAGPRRSAPPLIEPLSARELQVLRLICAGRSNREIADELVIALDTVKRHASNIYGKLGVKRRTQAILKARELDLL